MKIKIFLIFILTISLISCDDTQVFDEYQSVGTAWHQDSIIRFELPKMDEKEYCKLFVNIRSNNDYPFKNMFLLVSMEHPNGLTKVDTLEYEMANPDGSLMGEGFSATKESKLFYKDNFKFDKKGIYKVRIQQAVRQAGKVAGVKELKGITEVGFRVEK